MEETTGPETWRHDLLEVAGELALRADDDRRTAAAAILAATQELCSLCRDLLGTPAADAPSAREPSHAPPPIGVGDDREGAGQASLAAYLLGPLRVALDDQPVEDWNGHKSRCVFAYLLANRRKRIPKEVLLELLWPEADPDAGRRNLHQAVYSVRRTMRRRRPDIDFIRFEDGCYRLSPELSVWTDTEELERRVAAGRRLDAEGRAEDAVVEYGIADALYQGDFLEDRPYDDWTRPRRDELRSIHRHAAGRLYRHYIERGEHSAAIALCQKQLALDRCDEQAHRRVMRLYAAQGQRHLALHQFRNCASALRDDLGLAPSEETRALCRELTTEPRTAGLSTLRRARLERGLSPR